MILTDGTGDDENGSISATIRGGGKTAKCECKFQFMFQMPKGLMTESSRRVGYIYHAKKCHRR